METPTATASLVGPHADAPRARLIEEMSDVYLLVGAILQEEGAGDDGPFELLVADRTTCKFDADFLPMIRFFQTSRTERQALEWLAWADAPAEGLEDLVEAGLVVRVNTRNTRTAAKSLKGIKIVRQCVPGGVNPDYPSLMDVHREAGSPVAFSVPLELGHLLWGLEATCDIPTAIKRVARETGLPREVAARRVITNIPDLVCQGLAHLERVDIPR